MFYDMKATVRQNLYTPLPLGPKKNSILGMNLDNEGVSV